MRVGINIPWWTNHSFGADFGRRSGADRPDWRRTLQNLFNLYYGDGFFAVRWFIFTDGAPLLPNPPYEQWNRANLYFLRGEGGFWNPADRILESIREPQRIPPAVMEDLDCMLGVAEQAGIQVVPCFFSASIAFDPGQYGQSGRAEWLNNPRKRLALRRNIIEPIVVKLAEFPSVIYAVDIINEPERCTDIPWDILRQYQSGFRPTQPNVDFEAMRSFINESAQYIGPLSHLPSTVGFVDSQTPTLWHDLALNKVQIHCYERGPPEASTLAQNKPSFVGETAMKIDNFVWDNMANRTISGRLQFLERQGYDSVFFWSRRTAETPEELRADIWSDWRPEIVDSISSWIRVNNSRRGPVLSPRTNAQMRPSCTS